MIVSKYQYCMQTSNRLKFNKSQVLAWRCYGKLLLFGICQEKRTLQKNRTCFYAHIFLLVPKQSITLLGSRFKMLLFGPVARNKCSATKCKQLYLSPFGITYFVLKKNPANFQSSCANKSVAQVYSYIVKQNNRDFIEVFNCRMTNAVKTEENQMERKMNQR